MVSCTPGNTQPMTRVMLQRFVIMAGLNENYTSSDDSMLSGLFICLPLACLKTINSFVNELVNYGSAGCDTVTRQRRAARTQGPRQEGQF